MEKIVEDVQFTSGGELLAYLQHHGHARFDQWFMSMDEHGVWLTNPYGIDCGLVNATELGCQQALARISADTHEREWA